MAFRRLSAFDRREASILAGIARRLSSDLRAGSRSRRTAPTLGRVATSPLLISEPRPAKALDRKERFVESTGSKDGAGFTVWFTGLSGAGKSTLAIALASALRHRRHRVEILDGDIVRSELSSELGFSKEAREINVKRIGFVAELLSRNGVVTITATISPYLNVRSAVRARHGTPFIEVFVECAMDELLRRDTKGLYARALRGEIPHFTGVSDPYEPPLSPEIHIWTHKEAVEDSLTRILDALEARGLIALGDDFKTGN